MIEVSCFLLSQTWSFAPVDLDAPTFYIILMGFQAWTWYELLQRRSDVRSDMFFVHLASKAT